MNLAEYKAHLNRKHRLPSAKASLARWQSKLERQQKLKGTLLGYFYAARTACALWFVRNVLPTIVSYTIDPETCVYVFTREVEELQAAIELVQQNQQAAA
jgi:hypothetical protein